MHFQKAPSMSGTSLSLHFVTVRMEDPGSVSFRCMCSGTVAMFDCHGKDFGTSLVGSVGE
jgi:hypothetical protein